MRWFALGAVWLCGSAAAQSPSPNPVALSTMPVRDFSACVKSAILKALPDTLTFETSHNWGHQAHVPSLQGVKPIEVLRNHGDWEKARVTTWALPAYLRVGVKDVVSPDEDHIAFTVQLATPATAVLRKQVWQNGLEVYAHHVRVRFRLLGSVKIVASASIVAKAGEEPQRTVTFQVADATFSADDFVTENVNGIGGDLARLTNGGREFKAWRDPILREFREATLTAIQRAGTQPELRAGLSQFVVEALATRSAAVQVQTGAPTLPPPPPAAAAPTASFAGAGVGFPIWLFMDTTYAPVQAFGRAVVHVVGREIPELVVHQALGHAGSSESGSASGSHGKSEHGR